MNDGILLSNATVVVGAKLSPLDLEVVGEEAIDTVLKAFLKGLPSNVIARFQFITEGYERKILSECSRVAALQDLNSTKYTLQITLEKKLLDPKEAFLSLFRKKNDLSVESEIRDLLQHFDILKTKASLKILSKKELESIASFKGPYVLRGASLDFGSHLIGLVRLWRQGQDPISMELFSKLKDQVPKPFSIHVSVKRIHEARAEYILKSKYKKVEIDDSASSSEIYNEAQETLKEIKLHGGALFNLELYISITRESEEVIRSSASQIINNLKPLGEFKLETFGLYPSYKSTLIGEGQHVPLIEKDSVISSFLPVGTLGDELGAPQKRSLVVNRVDESLTQFDLFNSKYDSFSGVIIGKSGRGKSVLAGLLTHALANDPNVNIIKIDVGGSHSKETTLLGGLERRLTLSKPSGINPFSYLKSDISKKELVPILSNFLGVLLKEEGELFLSKALRGEIESAVQKYVEFEPPNPSIDDFYERVSVIPRKELLRRWVGGGVYGNAFRPAGSDEVKTNGLLYYNFAEIFHASDPDFSQGGMAAIIAQFNLELLESKDKKLVLICDEIPFFIKRCFEFFKFSVANVRKFGGSCIFIAQSSSDLVVNNDESLIHNSPSRFLFSVDGDEDTFKRRFSLGDEDVQKIKGLRAIRGQFSEVLLSDPIGSRVLKLRLSPEEYLRLSSHREDNLKIEKLIQAVPSLTLMEAIRCLSR